MMEQQRAPVMADLIELEQRESRQVTTGLDFGQALQAMRAGKWCTRPEYNGWQMTLKADPVADGNPIRWATRKPPQDTRFRGGLYLEEILATDWSIVE